MEGAGVVAAVGSQVKAFRVGDAVYGLHFKHPTFPPQAPGFCSEYALTNECFLLAKPTHLSFEEAASLPGSTLTVYQSIKLALEYMGPSGGTLEGKTVFVPGALSATGSVGCQVLKNVYGVGKLISTVSTPKVPLVEQYMPGIVDEVIDYQTQNIVREIGAGKVDFVYNTQWALTSTFPLANPKTGVIVSIASVPGSQTLRKVLGAHNIPFWMAWILDLVQLWYSFRLRGTNVQVAFVSGNPGNREDLEAAGEMIATGKVKAVMRVARLDDLEAVKKGAQEVKSGKGGIGKMIIKIV